MIVTNDNFGCSTPLAGTPAGDYLTVGAGGSYAAKLSVGAVMNFWAEFTTDNFTTGGATDPPPTGTFYVSEGLWLPAGAAVESPSSPGTPFFIMEWDATTPMGTFILLAFSGSETQKNGFVQCYLERTEDSPGNWYLHFKLVGWVVVTSDLSGYLNSNMTNRKRLLFSEGGSNVELGNTTGSVFKQQRAFRLAMWFNLLEPTMSNPTLRNWYFSTANLLQTHRWYNRDVLDQPATTVNTFAWEFKRNNVAVANLSLTEDTYVKVKWKTAPGLPCILHAWAIRTTNVDNAQRFVEAYDGNYVEVVTDGAFVYLPGVYGSLNPTIQQLWSPSTEATEVSAGNWEATFRIQDYTLTAGSAYRFIAVVYFDPGAALYESYSFISDNMQTNALPAICAAEAVGTISDYWKNFTNWLRVSPQERLRNTVVMNGDAYDACRSAGQFLGGVLQVSLTGYKKQGNLKHVVVLGTANRNALGVWSSTLQGMEVSQDYGANTLTMSYEYRVRYESDIPNIISYNGVAQLPGALSTQDWTNDTIYWDWAVKVFVIAVPINFYDNLVYRQRIDVHDYDTTCLVLTAKNLGGEIHRLCDSIGSFQFCAVNCVENEDRAIFGVDRFPYSINRFEEFESWDGGVLEQLEEPPIISADAVFESTDLFTACATVDATQLVLDELYRGIVIRKNDSAVCGSTGANGGNADTGTGLNTHHDIGGFSGRVYVISNSYGLADNFELYYGDPLVLQDSTGSVTFIAVMEYNYTAIFGEPQFVSVRVFGGGSGTGWDYFVFCPDFMPTCNAQYIQLLDLCLDPFCSNEPATCGVRSFFYIFPLGSTDGTAYIDFNSLPSIFTPRAVFTIWVSQYDNTLTILTTASYTVDGAIFDENNINSVPISFFAATGANFIFVTVSTTAALFPTCAPFSPRPFRVSVRCTDFVPDAGGVQQIGNVNILTYPMPNAADDDATITRLLQFPRRKLCTVDLLKDPCDGFNFHLCGNDVPFYQPFVAGDKLYFQFNFPDFVNTHPYYLACWVADPDAVEIDEWLASVSVVTDPSCGDVVPTFEEFVAQSYAGGDDKENSFQGVVIDTTNMPFRFFLKFTFNTPDGAVSYYTEPYQRVNCEETVLLEGVMSTKGKAATDCDGRYYGALTNFCGQFFYHRNLVRVWGNIEWNEFAIEVAEIGKTSTRKTRKETHLLRVIPSPVYMVQKVESTLFARQFFANNQEYVLKGTVPKKLINSQMWAMDIKLEARLGCDEVDFTCS